MMKREHSGRFWSLRPSRCPSSWARLSTIAGIKSQRRRRREAGSRANRKRSMVVPEMTPQAHGRSGDPLSCQRIKTVTSAASATETKRGSAPSAPHELAFQTSAARSTTSARAAGRPRDANATRLQSSTSRVEAPTHSLALVAAETDELAAAASATSTTRVAAFHLFRRAELSTHSDTPLGGARFAFWDQTREDNAK